MPRKIRIEKPNIAIGKTTYTTGDEVTLSDADYAAIVAAGAITKGLVSDQGDVPTDVQALAAGAPANLDTLGEVDTALGTKVTKPASPANGHTLAYSTALGDYTDVAPSGNSLMAEAKNVTGTVTSASAAGNAGTIVVIPGMSISVGDSGGRNVILSCGAVWQQTALGDGLAMLLIRETTGAVATLRSSYQRLPNSTTSPVFYFSTPTHEIGIGPVTTTRTFILAMQLWAPATNNPGASLLNTALNPTFLRAMAA